MKNGKMTAQQALRSIREALEEWKRRKIKNVAVFIPSQLRYIIAAYPNDALRFNMEQGETIYDVPVFRYESDDTTKFFLAQAYPVDPKQEIRLVHLPFYRPPKRG